MYSWANALLLHEAMNYVRLGYNFQKFGLLSWFIFPAKIALIKFVCSCVLFFSSFSTLWFQYLISACALVLCVTGGACAQATVYISVVCVLYGGMVVWWLGDWIKVSRLFIKASNSEQFVNGVTNTVMVLLESLLLRHQEWHHLNNLLWGSIVVPVLCWLL